MNIEKIKQTFERYITLLKFGKEHSHSKIFHHWEMILIVFLVFCISLLGFSIFLFLQINEGGIFLVEQSQEIRVDTIDRKVLQELITSLEIRDALFEERTISAPKLPDPSR